MADDQTERANGTIDQVVAVAKALSDPIRVGMLALMAQGRTCCPEPEVSNLPACPDGICVCEFQSLCGLGQSRISYHLRILREAGLIIEEARGKWSFYKIDAAAAKDFLATLSVRLGLQQESREPVR